MSVFVVVFLPILIVTVAGLFEYQRERRSLLSPGRALPLVTVVGLAVCLLIYSRYYVHSTSLSFLFSRTMTVVSLSVASMGFMFRYKSMLAAALVALAGTLLAILWLVSLPMA